MLDKTETEKPEAQWATRPGPLAPISLHAERDLDWRAS